MSRKTKTSMNWNNVTDYSQAVQHAKDRGASVREVGGLTELKGPAGTILLTGKGKEIIPHDTKKTLWKWFKLAGLLGIIFVCMFPDTVTSFLFGGV